MTDYHELQSKLYIRHLMLKDSFETTFPGERYESLTEIPNLAKNLTRYFTNSKNEKYEMFCNTYIQDFIWSKVT